MLEMFIKQVCREVDSGCVTVAHWTAKVTDGVHSASCYGSSALEKPEDQTEFIAYEDLTEELIRSWMVIDESQLEVDLLMKVEESKKPTFALGKPWEVLVEEPVVIDELPEV